MTGVGSVPGALVVLALAACGWTSSSPPAPGTPTLPQASAPGPRPGVCVGKQGTPGCVVQVPAGDGGPATWLQAREVRASEMAACLDAGGCLPDDVTLDGPFATVRVPGREDWPAMGVTWTGAVRYCAWIGGHLPDEATWVRAASAGDGRRWPWGDHPQCAPASATDRQAVEREIPRLLRFCEAVLDATTPEPTAPDGGALSAAMREACTHLRERPPAAGVHALRTFLLEPALASDGCAADAPVPVDTFDGVEHPLGLSWLAGNAAEWTSSPWNDGDPTRVYRGGSWMSATVDEFAVDHREAGPVDVPLPDVGLRCAVDAVAP